MSKKNVQSLQHPNWIFTIQYGGENQVNLNDVEEPLNKLEKMSSYISYGKEKAPSTGQEHLQGYVELLKPARRTELVKLISCFWEPAKGSGEQNRDYTQKEGDFYEVGTFKEQDPGKREQSRWLEARTQAEAGERVTDSQIVLQHYASIRALSRDHMRMPAELDAPCGVWIYGEAGAGKSRKARADYPGAYLKPCNKWWDGYQREKFVIIDDFDPAHACLGHYLKIWADRYPFPAEVKGSGIALRPSVICVTAQYSIDEIWPDVETRAALHRRYKSIRLGLPKDAPALLKAAFNSPADEVKRARTLGLEEETDDENEQISMQVELPRQDGESSLYVHQGYPLQRSSALLSKPGAASSSTHRSASYALSSLNEHPAAYLMKSMATIDLAAAEVDQNSGNNGGVQRH